MSSKATISELRKRTRTRLCRNSLCDAHCPQDAFLTGFREHSKGALPSIEAEGARWIPRRACGALHGVTSEASGGAGGAPCQWSKRHRCYVCGVARRLPSHAVAAMKSLTLLVGQYGVGGMSDAFLMLESQGFLAAPIDGMSKLGAVIRKNRDSTSRATERDVELLAVDQLRREMRVDIDDNLVNGRALCRVRGRGVPVVNMTEAIGRHAQLSATVEPDNRTYRINGFDRREFAVGDAERPVGRAELDTVPSCKDATLFAEDFDTEEPGRGILDASPIGGGDS